MNISRRILRSASLIVATLVGSASALAAQGVTTGAVTGTVRDAQGAPVEGAQIQVINRATGFRAGGVTRSNGLYYVQGLEVGGPYTVRARRIGFEPVEKNDIIVTLSQATRVDLTLNAAATQLQGVQVIASAATTEISPTKQGPSTQVSDTVIQAIPNLARNVTDLVKLTPQVSRSCNENSPTSSSTATYGCGASAGGQYNRYNNFTIDGANQNNRFNLNSSGGLPGNAGGGRIVSPGAVKEFKVLLAPTDVRQANFTGMLVNAVTKSGTNTWEGGATYAFRNEDLSAVNYRNTAIDFKQYGVTLGGPIIRDKLHFFIAPEWQVRTTTAGGAFVGGSTGSTGTQLNISSDSIALVQSLIQSKMGFDPGTSGRVDNDNPLTNLFARFDWQLNDVHRIVFRELYNKTDNISFSRNSNTFRNDPLQQNQGFRLGSNLFKGRNSNQSSVIQAYSNFASGRSNEFIAAYNTIKDERIVPQVTPEMSVGVVPAGATGSAATNPTAAITFGTEQFSIGNLLDQKILELQDNVTIPLGTHTATIGARYERARMYDNFPQALGGVWVFPNIAALQNLKPSGYAVAYPNSGNADDIPAAFTTNMWSAYAQDQWSSRTLTVTAGVRADVPSISEKPAENTAISNQFKAAGLDIHTSATPKTRILWSPRIGINWDINGNQTNQLRANTGVFTGPPPFILVANAYQNTGLGLVRLSCTGNSVPAFTIDQANLPHACLGQNPPANGAAGTLGINLTDPNFKYPQSYVMSAGYDHLLPFGFIGTVEGLYRHAINGVRIIDRNLLGPRMVNGQIYTDKNGRVLYADTINANGSITNLKQKAITSVNGTNFTEGAIYLTNQSKDYNWTLTGQLKKNFTNSFTATAAYTYNRAYDIQSLTSDRAISNWRNGREYSTQERDDQLTTSAFERRHRLIAYGVYTAPWLRTKAPTQFTVYFERQSGSPITYVSSLDLNGDGQAGNDPIYVPTSATDPNEIKIGSMNSAGVFTQDAAAAQAFDSFISSQKCLDTQRGTIMKRNSCFSPWQNRMDVSVKQSLPTVRGQRFSAQLDILNFANAFGKVLEHVDGKDRNWGRFNSMTLSAFPQQTVLSGNTSGGSIARSPGALNQSMPVYTFNTSVRNSGPFNFVNNLGYQMQLTFKYDF
jgi:hypothetical protein